eukprot:145549_1
MDAQGITPKSMRSLNSFSSYTPSAYDKPMQLETLVLLETTQSNSMIDYTMLNAKKFKRTPYLPDTSMASPFANTQQPLLDKLDALYFKCTQQILKGFENVCYLCACCTYCDYVDHAQQLLYIITIGFIALNFISPIYGICGGMELYELWSQYTTDDIRKICNKNTDLVHEIQCIFWLMIVCGITQYVLVFLFLMLRICVRNKRLSRAVGIASIGISLGWMVVFIFCLEYWCNIRSLCRLDSTIYVRTEHLFAWFGPLVLFECIKWSVCFLFLVVNWCCSFGNCNRRNIRKIMQIQDTVSYENSSYYKQTTGSTD